MERWASPLIRTDSLRGVTARALLGGSAIGAALAVASVYTALKISWSTRETWSRPPSGSASSPCSVPAGRHSTFMSSTCSRRPRPRSASGSAPRASTRPSWSRCSRVDAGDVDACRMGLGARGLSMCVAVLLRAWAFSDPRRTFPTGVVTAQLIQGYALARGERDRKRACFCLRRSSPVR